FVVFGGYVPTTKRQSQRVEVGSTVRLKDLDSGEALTLVVIPSGEAPRGRSEISADSPLGRALLGKERTTRDPETDRAVPTVGAEEASLVSSVLGLISVPLVPLVYVAAEMWEGSHPKPTIGRSGVQHDPLVSRGFLFCFLVFALLFLTLLLTRVRLLGLEEEV